MAGPSHPDLRTPSPPLATLAAETEADSSPPVDQPPVLEAVKGSFSIRLAEDRRLRPLTRPPAQ